MAQKVRFKRDWEFWPSTTVVMTYKKGDEKRIPQAQVEAALADRAAELIDPQATADDDPATSSETASKGT